jgi:hypothetical protein
MPKWKLAEGDAAEPSNTDWNDALEVWAKLGRLHDVLKRAKFAEQWGGVSFLRLYIPPVLGSVVPGDPSSGPLRRGSLVDLGDALSRVQVMSADVTMGGFVRDEHRMIRGIYYRYEVLLEDGTREQRVELHSEGLIEHFVWWGNFDAASLTLIPELSRENPFWTRADFYGLSYMMFPLEREYGSAITAGIRDEQDHLSAASTDLRRNGSLAGFPSWIFSNLSRLSDSSVSRSEGDSQITQRQGIPVGPGDALELVGLQVRDGAGNIVGYSAPDAKRLEPVNPEGTLREIDHWRGSLLRGFDRLWTETHLLSVSGVSRQEARASWDKRLLGETESTHEAVRWVLRSVLRLGLWLVGEELPDDLRVVPTLLVDVAPSNLELYRSLLDGYDRNVVSLETVINHTPVENLDTDVEILKVRQEREEAAAMAAEIAAAEVPDDDDDEDDGLRVSML